jgi:hypothetical protein
MGGDEFEDNCSPRRLGGSLPLSMSAIFLPACQSANCFGAARLAQSMSLSKVTLHVSKL